MLEAAVDTRDRIVLTMEEALMPLTCWPPVAAQMRLACPLLPPAAPQSAW